jgi:KipI family sensor histidine kinase inhibitor
VRVLPAGAGALLVEVADVEEVLALHRRLAERRVEGVVGLVPAARTVLVEFDPTLVTAAEVRALLDEVDLSPLPATELEVVEVAVRYDGPDLDDVRERLGMERDEFVAWHTSQAWRVAFTGFAPGFGYLVRPGHDVSVPRLASPRTRVPAGSVAMADSFSAVYPLETPGGWRIVGTTQAVLFDADRAQPATLRPGLAVRFVAS